MSVREGREVDDNWSMEAIQLCDRNEENIIKLDASCIILRNLSKSATTF